MLKFCRLSYFLCYYSLAGYPPFSDERKDMDLPKQILGGHYTFPKQYWKGISETGRWIFRSPEEEVLKNELL